MLAWFLLMFVAAAMSSCLFRSPAGASFARAVNVGALLAAGPAAPALVLNDSALGKRLTAHASRTRATCGGSGVQPGGHEGGASRQDVG